MTAKIELSNSTFAAQNTTLQIQSIGTTFMCLTHLRGNTGLSLAALWATPPFSAWFHATASIHNHITSSLSKAVPMALQSPAIGIITSVSFTTGPLVIRDIVYAQICSNIWAKPHPTCLVSLLWKHIRRPWSSTEKHSGYFTNTVCIRLLCRFPHVVTSMFPCYTTN